jgi:PIN domain nuclease of toxin-antitoxin system
MKFLLDTHLLLWIAEESEKLSEAARSLIQDPENQLLFSAASFWEIAIKQGLKRDDFQVNSHLLKRGLLDNGYVELPITTEHTFIIENLPPYHKDPFDRILVAQSIAEGITLLTADSVLIQYGSTVKSV